MDRCATGNEAGVTHSASNDNIRLWNAHEANEPETSGKQKSGVQFKIIAGHYGGQVSQMSKWRGMCMVGPMLIRRMSAVVDPASRFLITASSNRGWQGDSTRTVLVHDIKHVE